MDHAFERVTPVFVSLAVCIQEYQEHGTADHDSYKDHVGDVDPVQQAHCRACGSECQIYQEIEDRGRDEQQDTTPQLSLGKVGLPLGANDPQVALAEPPEDALEYPVHADGNHHYKYKCCNAVYRVCQVSLHPEAPCHDAVQPFNYSSHTFRFTSGYSNIRANKKLAPIPGPVC